MGFIIKTFLVQCVFALGVSLEYLSCCFHTKLIEYILEGGCYGSMSSDIVHLLTFASELF